MLHSGLGKIGVSGPTPFVQTYLQRIPTFTIETSRTIVWWLIAASGIILGISAQNGIMGDGLLVTIGLWSFVACVLLGLTYAIVLTAAVEQESQGTAVLDSRIHLAAAFLLNLTMWAFFSAIAGLGISLIFQNV